MKRRNFLIIVISGLLAIITRGRSQFGHGQASAPDRAQFIPGLTEIFRDPESAVAVGKVYLENYQGDDILAHLRSGVGIDMYGPAELHPVEFHLRRQKDFEQGNTMLFDGWVMARSEICACALLACIT